MRYIDLTGKVFGRLTVISKAPATEGNRGARWNCVCECGNTTVSRSDGLNNGRTKSCGCHRAELGGKRMVEMHTTHGMCGTPEYRTWRSIMNRCTNPNDPSFKDYGARGISVCDRWESFENFYADMGDKPAGLSIERLDVNGNYDPLNCVWADRETQANNKRNSHYITYEGVTKTLSQWAKYFNIPVWKLNQRLTRDRLSFDEAIINNDRRFKEVAA